MDIGNHIQFVSDEEGIQLAELTGQNSDQFSQKKKDFIGWIANFATIKSGKTTDIYFKRTTQVLRAKGLDKTHVVAEVTTGKLPRNWEWGVWSGVEEVAKLLEGLPIDVYCLPEGTIFKPKDAYGYRAPVMFIEGPCGVFTEMETPLLGLICQSTGIATASARIKKIAWDKLCLSFGIRRMHPAISPVIDRAAYIGGMDGVSCVESAVRLGLTPMGTMPHALIIVFGDQTKAWQAFDEVLPNEVPRIPIIDTYSDEKAEAILAAMALGDHLWGVRLDTPGSRRGNFVEIIKEVRWELDIRGYKHTKIFISGGIGEKEAEWLNIPEVDGFGIGTSISNSPVVDFALDIVEMEGDPVAKRGKLGGKKEVWYCNTCFTERTTLWEAPAPKCSVCEQKMERALIPLIQQGVITAELPDAQILRQQVIDHLQALRTREGEGRP
ncbi:MAG: nicotinate phosphoribosyltransferase [Candidatus Heimdallarchaeota archaeon]